MPSRVHLKAVFFGLLCCLAVLPLASAQKPKLSRVQVEQLVQAHAPDDLIASQIHTRGLSLPVNRKIVESFAAKGAGPLTLAALREQIREGEVEVRNTEPGSRLLVDGKDAGNTDGSGFLVVRELPEGNHELIAKKDGYRDASVRFALANKEHKEISLPLEWLGGFLSVSAQPADAAIHVTGPATFDGHTTDLRCQPGSYTVTASLEGYVSQTRTFQVAAGERHAEQVQLAADPGFVTTLVSEAKAKLAKGDFGGAIVTARKVLKLTPGEATAEEILAEASFQAGDFSTFINAGSKAISAGGGVTVPLMHVHAVFHFTVHDVTLTLDRSGMSFKQVSVDKGCKLEGFAQPYSLLSGADFTREFTAVSLLTVLQIRFVIPNSKGSLRVGEHDNAGNVLRSFNFVASGTTIGPHLQTTQPPNSLQALQSVVELMKRTAGRQ